MQIYDVFNGDADGICALHQIRLSQPAESILVTGVKRNIDLLSSVQARPGDSILVLDISLDRNREALERLLEKRVGITWFDHHFAGSIPENPALSAHINTSPDVCTSLLVNGHLSNRHYLWAITGAYGDNLHESARLLAESHGVDVNLQESLANLGMLLNYNGYGETVDDLHYHPARLYEMLSSFENPIDFINQTDIVDTLHQAYNEDIECANALRAEQPDDKHAVYLLPDTAWARRISGVYGNLLARQYPDRAHALLTLKNNGHYVVSVRAPLTNRSGADALCRQFPGGGGRKGAAGINDLPREQLESFTAAFIAAYK